MPERLMAPREVGAMLGVSVPWVLDHASGRRRPRLPSVKLGKVVRFREKEIEQFIVDCSRMKGAAQ